MALSRSFAAEAWLHAAEAARMAASSAARACWISCWCWAWASFLTAWSQDVVRSMAKIAAERMRRVRGIENLRYESWGTCVRDKMPRWSDGVKCGLGRSFVALGNCANFGRS